MRRSRSKPRPAAAVLLAALLAGTAALDRAAEPDAASSELAVAYHDGRLSVAARDAPLDAVLAAVGEAAGFEVRPAVAMPETFTGDFASLPLADGLRRLLRNGSFALRYDQSGSPELLVLLTTGPPAPAPPRPVAPAAAPAPDPDADPQVSLAQEERWIERRLPSPDLGTRIVAVRRLDRLPAERATALALRALGAEREPIVRAQLAKALGRVEGEHVVVALDRLLDDSDPSVRIAAAKALGGLASDAAVEGLGQVLLFGHEPALRQAAIEALASHPRDTARDYLRRVAERNGDGMAEAARQALAGETVLGATEDADGASPCLNAAGRREPFCRER